MSLAQQFIPLEAANENLVSAVLTGSTKHNIRDFKARNAISGIISAVDSLSTSLSNYYPKTETSSASQLTTKFATKLEANDVNMRYDTAARKIVLSSKTNVTSVDCTDFIKDGMLSTAELCGTTLVLKFNTDAGSAPISVEMSSFVDNYDGKISSLSDAIDQKIMFDDHISETSGYNDLSVVKLSADEYAQMLEDGTCLSNAIYIVEAPTLNAFKQRIINVAPGTGLSDAVNLQQLQSVSAGLTGDYYKKTETSSSIQIANALTSYYTKSQTSSSTQIANALTSYYTKSQTSSSTQIANALTSYYTKSQTSSASQISTALTGYYKKTETSSANQIQTAVNAISTYAGNCLPLSGGTMTGSISCGDAIGVDFNGIQVANGEQGDGFAVYVDGTAKYTFYDTADGDPPTAMPPQGDTDVNIMRGMDVYAVLGDISTLIHAI